MVMKIQTLSTNVIDIMQSLSNHERLANLLVIDKDEGNFAEKSDRPKGFVDNSQLFRQNDKFCRISPTPFNPNAEESDKSMIRVYYNQAEFDAEIISESTLHIDIIVAKNLWLAYDTFTNSSIVRPYAMIDAIMDSVGRRSLNPLVSVKFTGWQHLAVNTRFDAIRLYADYFRPEM